MCKIIAVIVKKTSDFKIPKYYFSIAAYRDEYIFAETYALQEVLKIDADKAVPAIINL